MYQLTIFGRRLSTSRRLCSDCDFPFTFSFQLTLETLAHAARSLATTISDKMQRDKREKNPAGHFWTENHLAIKHLEYESLETVHIVKLTMQLRCRFSPFVAR